MKSLPESSSAKRAIIYARVSTAEQANTGYSLAQQLEALRAYCKREGYEVLAEVSDPGQSGASLDRPGLDRVYELVEAGGVSVVLAQDRDRFAREPAYHVLLKEDFAKYGTEIRALNDRGDGSPEGELTTAIIDQIGKYERVKLAERSRRGKVRRVREGKIMPTHTPRFGFRYTADRKAYEVDPEQMAVVRRIFDMVGAEGMKMHAVKKVLDREGVPTPGRARYWSKPFIRSVILDDMYRPHTHAEVAELVGPEAAATLDPEKRYGVWYSNRTHRVKRQVAETRPGGNKEYVTHSTVTANPRSEWIPVTVPDSGIPRELVDAARAAIADNVRPVSRKHRTWELAGGITRCGSCGRKMFTNTITNRNLHYYRCPTRRDNGAESCPVTNRRADHLEAEVWESVRGILADPERLRADLDAMIEMKRRESRNDPTEEVNRWLKVFTDAEHQRANYQRAFAADAMSLAHLKARTAELDEECRDAQREIDSLQLRAQELADLEHGRDTLLESYAGASEDALDALTPAERHDLYKSLRIGVLAHADGSTEIILGNLLSLDDVSTAEVSPTPSSSTT